MTKYNSLLLIIIFVINYNNIYPSCANPNCIPVPLVHKHTAPTISVNWPGYPEAIEIHAKCNTNSDDGPGGCYVPDHINPYPTSDTNCTAVYQSNPLAEIS